MLHAVYLRVNAYALYTATASTSSGSTEDPHPCPQHPYAATAEIPATTEISATAEIPATAAATALTAATLGATEKVLCS